MRPKVLRIGKMNVIFYFFNFYISLHLFNNDVRTLTRIDIYLGYYN